MPSNPQKSDWLARLSLRPLCRRDGTVLRTFVDVYEVAIKQPKGSIAAPSGTAQSS